MPQRISMNIMTFLQHYRMHPCLWNRYHPQFKNRQAREKAEAVLLPISGLSSVRELKQKIRNIRCTYNQELAKIRRSVNSGSPEIYEPRLAWFAFADSFLRVNHIEKFEDPELHQSYTYPQELNGNIVFIKQEVPDEIKYHREDVPQDSPSDLRSESRLKETDPGNQEESYCSVADYVETVDASSPRAFNISKNNNNEELPPSNEFFVFGQHIAAQLQKLPIADALKLEEEIQSVITRARLKCLNK